MTDEQAATLLRRIRWAGAVTCPRCGSGRCRCCGFQGHNSPIRMYECVSCSRRFSDTTGTALYKTKIPLRSWLTLIDAAYNRPGITTVALSALIGFSRQAVARAVRAARDCPTCRALAQHLHDHDPRNARQKMLESYYWSRIDPPLTQNLS